MFPIKLSWLSMATRRIRRSSTLDAKEWAALPGTAFPYSGSIERAGITHANGVLKNAVSVDLKNVNFESSVQVQLYSGETLLTTATLQGVTPGRLWFPDLLHRYRDC